MLKDIDIWNLSIFTSLIKCTRVMEVMTASLINQHNELLRPDVNLNLSSFALQW